MPADPIESRLIQIARDAVRAEINGTPPPVPPSVDRPNAPVFVTIERGDGAVIGCRGALTCRTRALADEVAAAARSAAAHDPRYRPLRPADLVNFRVTVTLIRALQPLSERDIDSLPPDQGLVLTAGGRTGVVLPWEGRDPRVRLDWAHKKAGVPAGSSRVLQRMIAERFRG